MEKYKDFNIYTESFTDANRYRCDYLDSINRYLENSDRKSYKERQSFMPPDELVKNPNKFRKNYVDTLGKPLCDYTNTTPAAENDFVASDDMCDIYRLQIETLPDFKFYGMLLVPHGISGKTPLVICQHGGGGTPELCSDMHGKNNYSHMTRRILERKVVVFAPQLLLWNSANYELPYSRGSIDMHLKAVGSSITALEIYNIKKSIDYLEKLSFVDETKIGMTGLSYGGFFTLYTMAADERIKCGYSCGCFSDRVISHRDGKPCKRFEDWFWKNSENMFTDAEVAGLCAPRKLYLQIGKTDPVFDWKASTEEFSRVIKYYKAYGREENVKFDVWEGGHTVKDTDDGHDFFFKALYGDET